MTDCLEVTTDHYGQRYVCRAQRFSEHTHSERRLWLHPLPPDAIVERDEHDCLCLVSLVCARCGEVYDDGNPDDTCQNCLEERVTNGHD